VAVSDETALEDQIALWRAYVRRRPEVSESDAEELEDHLRDQVSEFTAAGLSSDEAFLIAVKRMGNLDELSREFAREHSERLWKQLVLTGEPGTTATRRARRDFVVMAVCAAAAALSIKVPALFGLALEQDVGFFQRNLSLFALPWLAAYFAWKRGVSRAVVQDLVLLFGLGAVAANAFPFEDDSHTAVLTAIHLPMALWLAVGVAYAGGEWRSDRKRMDFIRFTGEWLIYYVLIALGGGVLTGITIGAFDAIGVNAEPFVGLWLLPCGATAAVVVAGWLVEHKKSVVENMAPVLTRIFTPLFAAALVAFLVAVVWNTTGIDVGRDVLILFNVMLVVVLGLLLYAISAREPLAPPSLFDWQQLALVISALVIDALVLIEILSRIGEWGFSPNRVAALGENVILLTNLAWSAWLFVGFLRGRAPFARIDRWQTNYLVVYAIWAWAVVLAFPLLFNFA
jgi:hypothetical protein